MGSDCEVMDTMPGRSVYANRTTNVVAFAEMNGWFESGLWLVYYHGAEGYDAETNLSRVGIRVILLRYATKARFLSRSSAERTEPNGDARTYGANKHANTWSRLASQRDLKTEAE